MPQEQQALFEQEFQQVSIVPSIRCNLLYNTSNRTIKTSAPRLKAVLDVAYSGVSANDYATYKELEASLCTQLNVGKAVLAKLLHFGEQLGIWTRDPLATGNASYLQIHPAGLDLATAPDKEVEELVAYLYATAPLLCGTKTRRPALAVLHFIAAVETAGARGVSAEHVAYYVGTVERDEDWVTAARLTAKRWAGSTAPMALRPSDWRRHIENYNNYTNAVQGVFDAISATDDDIEAKLQTLVSVYGKTLAPRLRGCSSWLATELYKMRAHIEACAVRKLTAAWVETYIQKIIETPKDAAGSCLKYLECGGYVYSTPGPRGYGRIYKITPRGKELLAATEYTRPTTYETAKTQQQATIATPLKTGTATKADRLAEMLVDDKTNKGRKQLCAELDSLDIPTHEFAVARSIVALTSQREAYNPETALRTGLDLQLRPIHHAPGYTNQTTVAGGADALVETTLGIDLVVEATRAEPGHVVDREAGSICRHGRRHQAGTHKKTAVILVAPEFTIDDIAATLMIAQADEVDGTDAVTVLPLTTAHLQRLLSSGGSLMAHLTQLCELADDTIANCSKAAARQLLNSIDTIVEAIVEATATAHR